MLPVKLLSGARASNLILTARYDHRTIVLHWLTAGLVLTLWLLGQTIDWFPKGSPRSIARSTHIMLGLALALALLFRVWWRSTGGVRLPHAGSGALDKVATAVHKVLYILLFGTVVLGMANAWIRGDTLFIVLKIPAFDPGNTALRESVENWHSWAADLLLIVAGLHAVAALLHHFVLKDSILRRMLPRQ
jgi:cytochrome b561